jgi:hypothetical protein
MTTARGLTPPSNYPPRMQQLDSYGRRELSIDHQIYPQSRANSDMLAAYPASTPMPDQSYARPSPSVDPSSYGRERPSAPPGPERGAPRRRIN